MQNKISYSCDTDKGVTTFHVDNVSWEVKVRNVIKKPFSGFSFDKKTLSPFRIGQRLCCFMDSDKAIKCVLVSNPKLTFNPEILAREFPGVFDSLKSPGDHFTGFFSVEEMWRFKTPNQQKTYWIQQNPETIDVDTAIAAGIFVCHEEEKDIILYNKEWELNLSLICSNQSDFVFFASSDLIQIKRFLNIGYYQIGSMKTPLSIPQDRYGLQFEGIDHILPSTLRWIHLCYGDFQSSAIQTWIKVFRSFDALATKISETQIHILRNKNDKLGDICRSLKYFELYDHDSVLSDLFKRTHSFTFVQKVLDWAESLETPSKTYASSIGKYEDTSLNNVPMMEHSPKKQSEQNAERKIVASMILHSILGKKFFLPNRDGVIIYREYCDYRKQSNDVDFIDEQARNFVDQDRIADLACFLKNKDISSLLNIVPQFKAWVNDIRKGETLETLNFKHGLFRQRKYPDFSIEDF